MSQYKTSEMLERQRSYDQKLARRFGATAGLLFAMSGALGFTQVHDALKRQEVEASVFCAEMQGQPLAEVERVKQQTTEHYTIQDTLQTMGGAVGMGSEGDRGDAAYKLQKSFESTVVKDPETTFALGLAGTAAITAVTGIALYRRK